MGFSLDQAVCLTGCSRSQVRYWASTGLVGPGSPEGDGRGHLFSFRDLVELRTVKRMLEAGISLQKVRKTVEFLRTELSVERPLAQCRLVTDGSTVFRICEDGGQVMDTLRRGQLVFAIAIGDIAEEITCRIREVESDREAFISRLLEPEAQGSRTLAV
jgi:DNA-binding transcriptional MerR regulator